MNAKSNDAEIQILRLHSTSQQEGLVGNLVLHMEGNKAFDELNLKQIEPSYLVFDPFLGRKGATYVLFIWTNES